MLKVKVRAIFSSVKLLHCQSNLLLSASIQMTVKFCSFDSIQKTFIEKNDTSNNDTLHLFLNCSVPLPSKYK